MIFKAIIIFKGILRTLRESPSNCGRVGLVSYAINRHVSPSNCGRVGLGSYAINRHVSPSKTVKMIPVDSGDR